MTHTEEVITTHAQEANHNAERAYWWMKGINRDEAQRLGLNDMVNTTGGVLYALLPTKTICAIATHTTKWTSALPNSANWELMVGK